MNGIIIFRPKSTNPRHRDQGGGKVRWGEATPFFYTNKLAKTAHRQKMEIFNYSPIQIGCYKIVYLFG